MRQASIERKTKETEISVSVSIDGTGQYDVSTGIGFLDHMLEQLSRHSLMDLTVRAKGDTHIDMHHSVEDIGICLGEALAKAGIDLAGADQVVGTSAGSILGTQVCSDTLPKFAA